MLLDTDLGFRLGNVAFTSSLSDDVVLPSVAYPSKAEPSGALLMVLGSMMRVSIRRTDRSGCVTSIRTVMRELILMMCCWLVD